MQEGCQERKGTEIEWEIKPLVCLKIKKNRTLENKRRKENIGL
jgi:hypothetical protein